MYYKAKHLSMSREELSVNQENIGTNADFIILSSYKKFLLVSEKCT